DGTTSLALVPPQGEFRPGRTTGIGLVSTDPKGDHADLKEKGVDVDDETWGGDGTVPLGFFFRDEDGNQLLVAEHRGEG
ncbi:MAG TPA: hypothetical protein VEJ44_02250, partial [Acidimicrobiales bacterium]|nr:hypothetical protein [Acidimicrobiales bacterium]